MKRTLYGLFTYFEFFGLALAFIPMMAVVTLVSKNDPGRRRRGRWMRYFGRLTSGLTPLWDFSVEGDKPAGIDEKAFVVVSNHISTADPFLLSWLPWDMRWVAKYELFKQPIIGQLMSLSGDIALKRGHRSSIKDMFDECRRTLDSGVSVMLFPEGTRSADGELLPFKDGAFSLAIQAQVPVLPMVIRGTRECRPKGSLWFGQAKAAVRVLEPISTEGLTEADVEALKDRVRTRIEQELRAMLAEGLPGVLPMREAAAA